jgi:hypothetical protein
MAAAEIRDGHFSIFLLRHGSLGSFKNFFKKNSVDLKSIEKNTK